MGSHLTPDPPASYVRIYVASDLLTPMPCRHVRKYQFGVAMDFS